MSKINKGQKVKVLKPGIFNEMIGSIVSISYNVDMGALGVWTFKDDDLLPFANGTVGEAKINDNTEAEMFLTASSPEPIFVKSKRQYNKQPKEKPTQEKRKYQRKQPKQV